VKESTGTKTILDVKKRDAGSNRLGGHQRKMLRISFSATVIIAMLFSNNVVMAQVKSRCRTKNWDHGTNQAIAVTLPEGSSTQEIIISVKNLEDKDFEGTCPNAPPPPTLLNGFEKQCTPGKFADTATEWVRDEDEDGKHTVTIDIKNDDQAPPRTVKLCVKYTTE